jgi:hypothetical protein
MQRKQSIKSIYWSEKRASFARAIAQVGSSLALCGYSLSQSALSFLARKLPESLHEGLLYFGVGILIFADTRTKDEPARELL